MVGIFNKIFKAKKVSATPLMSAEHAEKILQSYGPVLEEKAKNVCYVADESKLPFPKEQIKKAIIYALLVDSNPETKEPLTVAYLELALWQKGVGEKDVMYMFDSKDDLSIYDQNLSPKDLGQKIADIQKRMDTSWMNIINEERLKLAKELDSFKIPVSIKSPPEEL